MVHMVQALHFMASMADPLTKLLVYLQTVTFFFCHPLGAEIFKSLS